MFIKDFKKSGNLVFFIKYHLRLCYNLKTTLIELKKLYNTIVHFVTPSYHESNGIGVRSDLNEHSTLN